MQNTKETPVRERKQKINADILKFSDFEPGHTFQGKLLSRSTKPWTDKETGELKDIPVFHFETADKSRVNVFGDSGLVNAITGANVQEGQWIEIEKLEQVKLANGRKVNQYDIYELN